MTASSSLPFHESPHRYFVMRNLYESAVKQLVLKLEILNSEFNTLYARNPIHHIESRVKSSESIAAKLQRKGSPVTLEAAARDINDIAGVRVVCNYIDDVYRVAGMLERQEDLEIVKRQDYIKTPNYNGYRSLHLDVRVPVYLSDRTEHVVAEIQIRTIAMDFWASLEHDIHYKADRAKLPAGIDEEMFACAEKIAEIDRQYSIDSFPVAVVTALTIVVRSLYPQKRLPEAAMTEKSRYGRTSFAISPPETSKISVISGSQ